MPLPRQLMTVELEDGRTLDLEAINPDYLRVERSAPQLGLPTDPKAAPMTYMTAVAWAALKRTGEYAGELADFLNRECVNLLVHRAGDEEAVEPVPPTLPAPVTGSP